jgi:hypothetical protein
MYIYCYWVWTLTFLYFLGIYPYTHLGSLLGAILFTIWFLIIGPAKKVHWSKKLVIITWEFFIFELLRYKIGRPWNPLTWDLQADLILFILYNLFLWSQGETFFSIYFGELLKKHSNPKQTILQYIVNKF